MLRKYFLKPVWRDFLEKTLFSLGMAYLLLFVLETIFSGVVIKAININWILGIFLLNLAILVVFYKKVSSGKKWISREAILFKLLRVVLLGLFLIGLFFALYKVSLVESLIYILLAGFVFRQIFKQFSPEIQG